MTSSAMALFAAALLQLAPQVPDSKTVTSVTEAAKLCQLSEAGIDWSNPSPKVLAISLTEQDLKEPSSKMELLKACIFTWAYDREVSLELSIKK